MGTYKEVDGLRYTMEQLQNSGEKDQFPTGKGDLVASFKYIEDYMNQNCHPNTTLGAALHGDGLLTDHGVEHVTISGRGTRVDDDIRRYAIPNYIKKLGGTKKSRSTFRYAGLENMIHLSSGIIRNLLDAAANMYDAACAQCGENTSIAFIDTDIQNRVLRNQSDAFLYTELRHSNTGYENASELQPIASPKNDIEKLQNLICAMGQTFHDILVSDRSERKVFSIALSNAPDDEIKRVLKTGVRLGYLHEATIGNKAGNGRTCL